MALEAMMAARRKTIDEATLDAVANRAAARAATVVAEQMQGQFRAFGEALDGLREHVTRGFDEMTGEMNRRFEQVDRRFDRVEQELGEVKHELGQVKDAVMVHQRQLRDLSAAVDKKVDRDEVEGIVERAVGRAVGH